MRRKDAERAAAVHQRGLLELAGHRLERDAHHEGRERQLEHRQHQAQAEQRVLQAEAVEQHVQRDEQRRVRDHEDGQREQEQHVAAREVEAGEGVAAEARDRERDRHGEDGDDDAVEQVLRAGPAPKFEQRGVVAQPVADHLPGGGLRAHRCDRAPQQREQEDDREPAGQHVVGRAAQNGRSRLTASPQLARIAEAAELDGVEHEQRRPGRGSRWPRPCRGSGAGTPRGR